MRGMVALFSLAAVLALSVEGIRGGEMNAAVQPALERFLARVDEPITHYRARRTLQGHNGRFDMRGGIDAITELTPDGGFTYTVVNATGSDYIREKVLLPILEAEVKAFASGNAARSALTADNYDIAGGEPAEPGIVKLFAKPRRRDISLIDGALFVTSDEADLVRVEGRMSKNPSFWTTRVNVIKRYDRIGGIRVPVSLESTAQIRFAGESTLSMVYDYEMINGVPVD